MLDGPPELDAEITEMLLKYVKIVLASVTLIGCATTVTMTTLSFEERQAIQTRRYDAPDSLLYTAAMSSLVDIGYTIQVSDRAVGLIQTASLTYRPDPNQDALAGAMIGYAPRFSRSVSVRVKGGAVRLDYSWQKTDRYGWRPYEPDAHIARQEYATLFKWIDSKLSE